MKENQETQDCPFCGASLLKNATFCYRCNAEKGAGILGKFGVVGKWAVWPARVFIGIFVITTLFFLAAGIIDNEPGMLLGGILFTPFTAFAIFYNRDLLFFKGEYHWYR